MPTFLEYPLLSRHSQASVWTRGFSSWFSYQELSETLCISPLCLKQTLMGKGRGGGGSKKLH